MTHLATLGDDYRVAGKNHFRLSTSELEALASKLREILDTVPKAKHVLDLATMLNDKYDGQM